MTSPSPISQDRPATHSAARIILVEDDDELREGLAETLRLSGMQVIEAGSGMAFREAWRSQRFDVAILDVNLPDTNGFELARTIADGEPRPGIIMLTARTGQQDRIQGYSEGADLYMTKPVVGEELLLAVRNLARRTRHATPTVPLAADEAPPWRLDVRLNRLTAPDGRILDLSSRETMLIEQFANARDTPIPRGILAGLMGYGAPSAENRGLDIAIRRLRQKMADAGLEPPIVPIHGVGIRFHGLLTIA
jgi:DNA-binding response OmpR family regulator